MKLVLFLIAVLSAHESFAETLVLGRVARITPIEGVNCGGNAREERNSGVIGALCIDAWYRWIIDVEKTIAGVKLHGRVYAVKTQHQKMRSGYPKQLQLFVLDPIQDPKQRKTLRAKVHLVDMSPTMFCIYKDPKTFGLAEAWYVSGSGGKKVYCFHLPYSHGR